MLGVQSLAICGALLPVLVLLIFLRVDKAFKVQSSDAQNHQHSLVSSSKDGNDGWTYIGTKGGIETYVKKVDGSPLLAFRGVAYLDMHISKAMGPYINLTTAYDWISMLKHIQKFPVDNARLHDGEAAEDLVYQVCTYITLQHYVCLTPINSLNHNHIQVLELPWPVSPRDVLLHRNFHFDPAQRTVAVHYRSVQDSRIPLVAGVVRADSPHSMWRFRSLSACDANVNEPSAPVKKVVRHTWLQRKVSAVKQRFSSKKHLDVEISIKFARNQPKSTESAKPVLVQGSRSLGVPKRPVLHALLSLLPSQKSGSFESEKIRPVYTGSDPVHGVHHQKKVVTSGTAVAEPVVHGGLAQLTCRDTTALRHFSKHNIVKSDTTVTTAGSTLMQGKVRSGGTIVEFESFVNSKGNIPAWFINYMQR